MDRIGVFSPRSFLSTIRVPFEDGRFRTSAESPETRPRPRDRPRKSIVGRYGSDDFESRKRVDPPSRSGRRYAGRADRPVGTRGRLVPPSRLGSLSRRTRSRRQNMYVYVYCTYGVYMLRIRAYGYNGLHKYFIVFRYSLALTRAFVVAAAAERARLYGARTPTGTLVVTLTAAAAAVMTTLQIPR